jgi:hypothetical protein
VMGAAGSLGYDVVRPFRGALFPEATLYADPASTAIDRESDVSFTPLFGPARALHEREVFYAVRALAARPAFPPPPSFEPLEPPSEPPTRELQAVPAEP